MMHINYFNFEKHNDTEYLISNDAGRYLFITNEEFQHLINKEIEENSELADRLSKNYFISFKNREIYISELAEAISYYKDNLFIATSLHIFVLTTNCNQRCVYCQASAKNNGKSMTEEIAKRSVDIALSSPNKYLSFEFQGGEPLMNYDILKFIVEYTEKTNTDKIIRFNLVSNITLLTDEMIDYFVEHKINVSTSLDGNEFLHSHNRPFFDNSNFYTVINNIKRLRNAGIEVGAIQTTTRQSFNKYKEIVDQYVECGFKSIFIRPLTPLGYAKTQWNRVGYTAEEFLDFYFKSLDYIRSTNLDIEEGHYNLFKNKIIEHRAGTYTELRSPCGAAIGQLAYYCDGNIYTCDEGRMLAEMGNDAFKLGTVYNTYDELTNGSICKTMCAASCLETLPKCDTCVCNPFCGVCPVINFGIYNSVFSKKINDYKCIIYKNIIYKVLEDFKH